MVRTTRICIFLEALDNLENQPARLEEKKVRPPFRVRAVQPQIKPKPRAIVNKRSFPVWGRNHEMIHRVDDAGLGRGAEPTGLFPQ